MGRITGLDDRSYINPANEHQTVALRELEISYESEKSESMEKMKLKRYEY
jgi:hypothetical protein